MRKWSLLERLHLHDLDFPAKVGAALVSDISHIAGQLITGRQPLVGRQREFALLWSHFERASTARAGRADVVMVSGEPGLGKTRVLDELAAHASNTALILRGGASEAEGMPPYLPFLEALGRYIRTVPGDLLREQTGYAPTLLAEIFPELAQRMAESASAASVIAQPHYAFPPEQARLRLYEAVAEFLGEIAQRGPLLLLLDDLQWCDPASLDLLCFVARWQPQTREAGRLLVVGAYREGEQEQNGPLKRALTELTRLRLLTTLSLGPLSGDELSTLAASYLGGTLDAVAQRHLQTHSEGNPFFAEELLRSWMESGALARKGKHWVYNGRQDRIVPDMPAGIHSVIEERLSRMSAETLEILRLAAVIGKTFDSELLTGLLQSEQTAQRAQGASTIELEAVEEQLFFAIRAHLILKYGRGGESGPGDHASSKFVFSHDKIRECLYEQLPPARRTRLHGMIGHELEQHRPEIAGGSPAQRLATLAFHFARSRDRGRGATYARQAAEYALGAYAYEEAMTHYGVALAFSTADDPVRGELLLGLGEAALLAGFERESIRAYEAAQTWFQNSGMPEAVVRALHGLGRAYWRLDDLAKARAALEQALAVLDESSALEVIGVLVDLGTLLTISLGEPSDGLRYGERAVALAEQCGDARLGASANRSLGNMLVRTNRIREGIPLLQRALDLAVEEGNPVEAAECCAFLATAYYWLGDFERSEGVTRRRLDFATHTNDPYQLRHVYSWLAFACIAQGRWEEAERMLSRAEPIVKRLDGPEPLAFLLYTQGVLHWQRGESGAAERYFIEALDTFEEHGLSPSPSARAWYVSGLALAQFANDKAGDGALWIRELEEIAASQPAESMEAFQVISSLALIALKTGDLNRADGLYARLLPFRDLYGAVLTERVLANIAMLRRDWRGAEEHLARAEAQAREHNIAPELGRVLLAEADLAVAMGDRSATNRASTLLEEAAAIFTQLQMHEEADQIRRQIEVVQRGRGVADKANRRVLPAGLTEREAEVLRLVAAGKSNRQIGEELSLSARTVENHLASIFGKIDADNRAAATAFAVRHGLA